MIAERVTRVQRQSRDFRQIAIYRRPILRHTQHVRGRYYYRHAILPELRLMRHVTTIQVVEAPRTEPALTAGRDQFSTYVSVICVRFEANPSIASGTDPPTPSLWQQRRVVDEPVPILEIQFYATDCNQSTIMVCALAQPKSPAV